MSQEFIPPFLLFTITFIAILSYWNNLPCSGSIKNSSIWLAVLPMHQQSSELNDIFIFLLCFTMLLTSKVLVIVTIGIGELIHISNADARLVSFGSISFIGVLVKNIAVRKFLISSMRCDTQLSIKGISLLLTMQRYIFYLIVANMVYVDSVGHDFFSENGDGKETFF